MKLVLFVGHHKVGSTSLQTFLACNQRKLRRAGILYPGIEQTGLLATMRALPRWTRARTQGLSAYERLTFNTREPHNALAFKMMLERRGDMSSPPFHGKTPCVSQMVETIQEQIARYQPETTILCAEAFANFSGKAGCLAEHLRHMFPAESVQIVCILRRIDQYIASWYSQRLRFGHRLSPLREDGLDLFLNTIHVDYRRILKSWRRAFPEAEFSVKNYADVLNNGGTVKDFFRICGVSLPARLEPVHITNASIPRAYFELCRQANLTLKPAQALHIRKAIIKGTQVNGLPAARNIEVLGEANRIRLYENFQPVLKYLNRTTEYANFFPDQEQVLRLCEYEEYPAAVEARDALLEHAGVVGLSGEPLNFIRAFQPGV